MRKEYELEGPLLIIIIVFLFAILFLEILRAFSFGAAFLFKVLVGSPVIAGCLAAGTTLAGFFLAVGAVLSRWGRSLDIDEDGLAIKSLISKVWVAREEISSIRLLPPTEAKSFLVGRSGKAFTLSTRKTALIERKAGPPFLICIPDLYSVQAALSSLWGMEVKPSDE